MRMRRLLRCVHTQVQMRGLPALAGVVCLCAAGVHGGGRERHLARRKSRSHNHDAQKSIGVKQVQGTAAVVVASTPPPTPPPTPVQPTGTPTSAPVVRAPTFGGGKWPFDLWPPVHPHNTPTPEPTPTPEVTVKRPKPWWFQGRRPHNATLPGDEVLAENYTLFESGNGTGPNIKMYLPSAPIHYNESLETWYVVTNTLDFKLYNVTLEVDISDRKGLLKSPVTVPSVNYDWRDVGGFFMPNLDPGESFVVQVWVWCYKKRIKKPVTITHTATLFPPDEELSVANGTSSGNLPLGVTVTGTMIAEPGPGPEYDYERPNEYGVNDPHYYDDLDTPSPTPAPSHNLLGPRPVHHGSLPPGQHFLPPGSGIQHGYRPPIPHAGVSPRPPVQHGIVAPPHRPGGVGLGIGSTRDAPVGEDGGVNGGGGGDVDMGAGGDGSSDSTRDEPVNSVDTRDQPKNHADHNMSSNAAPAPESQHTTAAPNQEAVTDNADEGSVEEAGGEGTAPPGDLTESDAEFDESDADTHESDGDIGDSDDADDDDEEDGERSSVSFGGMVIDSGSFSPSSDSSVEGVDNDEAADDGEAESDVSSQGGSEGDDSAHATLPDGAADEGGADSDVSSEGGAEGNDSAHKLPVDASSGAAADSNSNGGIAVVANRSSQLHAAVMTDETSEVVKDGGNKQRHSRSHGGKKASQDRRVAGSTRYRRTAGLR